MTAVRNGYRLVQCGVLIVAVIGQFILAGCSNDASGPDAGGEFVDRISGNFYLEGFKIEKRFSDWPIPPDEEPSIDTTRIDFSLTIVLPDPEQDEVRFYGLSGADVGESDHRVYPGCTVPEDCKVFGQRTDLEEIAIILENDGRMYHGFAYVRTNYIGVQAEYQYQNITIEYDLDGQRFSPSVR